MTDLNNRMTFNQRLRSLEAKRATVTMDAPPVRARGAVVQILRMIAILPVMVVLAKGWTIAFMGPNAYVERLVEIQSAGGLAAATAGLLVPDRLSLGIAGMISGLPGLS